MCHQNVAYEQLKNNDMHPRNRNLHDANMHHFQLISRLGPQSITVQTFPGPTSEFEDTRLVSLSTSAKGDQVERPMFRRIKLFLDTWILPSWITLASISSLILIVEERQRNPLKVTKVWQLYTYVASQHPTHIKDTTHLLTKLQKVREKRIFPPGALLVTRDVEAASEYRYQVGLESSLQNR